MKKNNIKKIGISLLTLITINSISIAEEETSSEISNSIKKIAKKTSEKDNKRDPGKATNQMFSEDSKNKEVFEVRKEVSEIPGDDKKIGVALGGGSAKGLAHIGILKVMEEEKVPIEYVTGTSMGSIIGGLYAAGYTATEIEQIAIDMDWINLFNDMIKREEKGLTRNLVEDGNVTSLPMEGLMPKIPTGLVGGKSAMGKLNELLYGTLGTQDFKKLPRKFAAVATDLNTGVGVMIDKGSLPVAIRSSLSLPSIFNPMQVGDKLYIDGGVIRNLPVQDAKVIGADYTIGINVGEGFTKRDPEKMNVVDVISDSMTIAGRQEVARQARMADIYIAPDLENIQSYDFMKVKEIIAMGEKVARDNIEEIRKLSNPELFDKLEEKRKEYRNNWVKEYDIKSVKIQGNKQYSTEYFNKYIPKKLGKMTEKDMKKIVDELFTNGNFSTVYYEIDNDDTLIINVQEKAGNYLVISGNANNEDYMTARIGIQGNKTFINDIDTRYELNFVVGNEYGVNGAAIASYGKNNRMLVVGKYDFKRDLIKNQEQNGKEYDYENQKGKVSIGIGGQFTRNSMLLLSGGYQASKVKDNINENENVRTRFPFLEVAFTQDNRDAVAFPTRGSYVKAEYTKANSSQADFDSIYASAQLNIPVTKKITITPSVVYVTSDGDKIPETYRPKLGGFRDSDYSLKFDGVPMDKLRGDTILTGGIRLQYQFNRFLYGGINALIARVSDQSYKVGGEKYESYGIGFGARLPIGPFYFGIAKTPGESIRYFLNFGYQIKGFNEN